MSRIAVTENWRKSYGRTTVKSAEAFSTEDA
jgi:hypothetical protein